MKPVVLEVVRLAPAWKRSVVCLLLGVTLLASACDRLLADDRITDIMFLDPFLPPPVGKLVLPPRLAPKHVVILPIYKTDEERSEVLTYCDSLKRELEAQTFSDGPIEVLLDDRDIRAKHWEHIKKGVSLRVEVGPKDIAKNGVFLGRRDTGEKQGIGRDEFVATVSSLLTEIQDGLLARAKKLRDDNTCDINNLDDFKAYFTPAFLRTRSSNSAAGALSLLSATHLSQTGLPAILRNSAI